MAENLERKKNDSEFFHENLHDAGSESVLRFSIRRSVVELQGDKHFFAYRR